MSSEWMIHCGDCGWEWWTDWCNDGFEQDYPFCPECASEEVVIIN